MSITTEWRGVRVRQALLLEIDKLISNASKYGVPKYESRANFVESACIALLEKETQKPAGKMEVTHRV